MGKAHPPSPGERVLCGELERQKKRERSRERKKREFAGERLGEREKRRGEDGRWWPLDRGRKSEEGNRDERKRRKREMGDILERE